MDDHLIIKFLLMKRIFIFFDEWLTYFILYQLYSSGYFNLFYSTIPLAILFNGYAYKCYWSLEEKYNNYLIKKIY